MLNEIEEIRGSSSYKTTSLIYVLDYLISLWQQDTRGVFFFFLFVKHILYLLIVTVNEKSAICRHWDRLQNKKIVLFLN